MFAMYTNILPTDSIQRNAECMHTLIHQHFENWMQHLNEILYIYTILKVTTVTHMKQYIRKELWIVLPLLNPKTPHYLHLFYINGKSIYISGILLFLTPHFFLFHFETQNSHLTFSVDYFAHVGSPHPQFLIFIPFRFPRSTAQLKSKFQIDLFQHF